MASGSVSMSTIRRIDPPGWPHVDDGLTDQMKQAWSDEISSWEQVEITAKFADGTSLPGPRGTKRTPLPQFFNPTAKPFIQDQKPKTITWTGFPGIIERNVKDDRKRWELADKNRMEGEITVDNGDGNQTKLLIGQDEYLEWSVMTDPETEKIISVTFTCEGPEYWEFLAKHSPDKVLELYHKYNPDFAGQIKKSDLFPRGEYKPDNKWNTPSDTGCIMHLVQENNTLGAEVDIAAQGTVIRKDSDGNIVTDPVRLCNCSAYGVASRNSDPKIGSEINSLAREGTIVTIANPVGIYMKGFDTGNLQLDSSGEGDLVPIPKGTFQFQRGSLQAGMGLRLRIKIPDGTTGTGDLEGKQLTVSDIFDSQTKTNIIFGAQFADYISMGVNGVGISGGKPAKPRPCPGEEARALGLSSLAAETTSDEFLGPGEMLGLRKRF